MGQSAECDQARLDEYLNEVALDVQTLDRAMLEDLATQERNRLGELDRSVRRDPSLEQLCVNYLRHTSNYDKILTMLSRPELLQEYGISAHVLDIERRAAKDFIKKRVLDEIAEKYPWLKEECSRQKWRDGLEDDPGEFIFTWGPYKGMPLKELPSDYLLRLLGKGRLGAGLWSRVERHLGERMAHWKRAA